MLHISIKAEPIFKIFGFSITNSLFLSLAVLALFLILALNYYSSARKKTKNTLFYLMTFVIRGVHSLFESIFQEKTGYFFPLVGSFFFFILFQNWLGLIPGVGSILIKVMEHSEEVSVPLFRSNTADLNTTLTLALISVVFSQYVGIKHLGFIKYIQKFINLKSPMMFFTGLMETISEVSKIVSFSFRLFGNIFAGEVILGIVAFLVPILASFPFFLFEIFVGFVQAIVFAMLSGVFYKLAIEEAH